MLERLHLFFSLSITLSKYSFPTNKCTLAKMLRIGAMVLCLVTHSFTSPVAGYSIKSDYSQSRQSTKSPSYLDTTKSLLPTNTRSNLEILVSMAPGFNNVQQEEDRQRGVVPVTHEEVDPLPLPDPSKNSSESATGGSSKVTNSSIPAVLVSGSQAFNKTLVVIPGGLSPDKGVVIVSSVGKPPYNEAIMAVSPAPSAAVPLSSLEENLYAIKEDQPRPLTNFQNIKDAYFDLLQQFKEFKIQMAKKIEKLEQKVERTHDLDLAFNSSHMGHMNVRISEVYLKVLDVDFRHNLTRLMDLCVEKILANEIDDAVLHWHKIELSLPDRPEYESSTILKEITSLAYTKNKSNSSPVYKFLGQLEEDLNKIPSYEFLLERMDKNKNFDGPAIFYIAQYLKEHNSIRSNSFSKIPKSVQHAVSGRNVNIVFKDPRPNTTGRTYVHVRDDGTRRERSNYYIKASSNYSDAKAAIWRTIYYPLTGTFRLRNLLFNDYILANEEGFLETTSMANANQRGTEFQLSFEKGNLLLQSVKWNNAPVVSHYSGGKFPYFFSISQDSNAVPAVFNIEPDTLLYDV